MRFSFAQYPTKVPVPSLGGAMSRPKPVIPFTLFGPTGHDSGNMLLDTGADDVVFPLDLAQKLGVDLRYAVQGQAAGVGRTPFAMLYAPMILEVHDALQVCRWRSVVAFTSANLRLPLFGIAGGLIYFRSTLDVEAGDIILEPKPSLPVTLATVP